MSFRLPLPFFLALLLVAPLGHADGTNVFGSGRTLVFRETLEDRRFARSRLNKALSQGNVEPGCVQLLGGLLTILAETAPLLHNKDESFVLDPNLIGALQSQLSTEFFPAPTYFTLMVRRVRLEGHLPPEWHRVAMALNPTVQTIDMGKLRMLALGVKPIDSAYFSLPMLRERFQTEVERANSATAASAYGEFRDAYLDHEVAFGGLTLVDLSLPETKEAKGDLGPVAVADWLPPDPNQNILSLEPMKPRVKVRVKARLAARQHMDLSRIPKGHRVLLRGRFWDINRAGTEVELRDAVLFEDRDWSQGTLLANPAVVATCSVAVNDLQGLGGGQQPGAGAR